MLFLELINKYEFEDLVEINNKYHILDKKNAEVLFNNVKNFLNTTEKQPTTEITHLFVSINEDMSFDEEIYETTLEEDDKSYYFHVTGYTNTSDMEHYAIDFEEWYNYKNLIIDDICLDTVGEKKCLLAILYEMSWFGVENTQVEEGIKQKCEELDEAFEYIKNGGKTYSLSEILEDIDEGPLYEEEKESYNNFLRISHLIDSGNRLCEESLKIGCTKANEYWNYSLNTEEKIFIRRLVKNGVWGFNLLKACQRKFSDKDLVFKSKNN